MNANDKAGVIREGWGQLPSGRTTCPELLHPLCIMDGAVRCPVFRKLCARVVLPPQYIY